MRGIGTRDSLQVWRDEVTFMYRLVEVVIRLATVCRSRLGIDC